MWQFSYPVQNGGPPLHGDALEDGEHGKANVIKVCDSVVRPIPGIEARRVVGVADEAASRSRSRIVCVAGRLRFPLLHDHR